MSESIRPAELARNGPVPNVERLPEGHSGTTSSSGIAGRRSAATLGSFTQVRLLRPDLVPVELVVATLVSFREVGVFQRTLSALSEAHAVEVRHVHHGTLQVRVLCDSVTKLLEALAQAYSRPFVVVSREPHRVEIALSDDRSLSA